MHGSVNASDSRDVWVTDPELGLSLRHPAPVSDKRLAIDLTALRQLWRSRGSAVGDVQVQEMPEDATDKIYWIATQDMLVDSMTKAMRDDLRRALDNGTDDAYDTCTGDFVKATVSAAPTPDFQHVRAKIQVLQGTELLLQELQGAELSEAPRICESWQRQLASADVELEHWVQSRVEATQNVLQQEVQTVAGMLGQVDFEKLRVQIQELWLVQPPAAPLAPDVPEVAPEAAEPDAAEAAEVDELRPLFQPRDAAFGQVRQDFFARLEAISTNVEMEELLSSLQQQSAQCQDAGRALGRALASMAADVAPISLEEHWQKQAYKVAKDGAALIKDLETLFSDSFARPGENLWPDIHTECENFLQKMLAMRNLAAESGMAALYEGFIQTVTASVAHVAQDSGRVVAGGNLPPELRAQIQEVWEQHVGARSHGDGRSERSGSETRSSRAVSQEARLERPVQPSKVLRDGEELLKELESIFNGSWARPWDDLGPDIEAQITGWQQKQPEAHPAAKMYQDFAILVQSTVARSVDGASHLRGDFQTLKAQIQESWISSTQQVRRSADISAQVSEDGEELLRRLEVLFTENSTRQADLTAEISEQIGSWRQLQLDAHQLETSSTGAQMYQGFAALVQSTIQRLAGDASGAVAGDAVDFPKLRAQIQAKGWAPPNLWHILPRDVRTSTCCQRMGFSE
ncbi:unnamed protein product [Effrenium voratum]|nr:unnamed protein product [Effrenium voratum]